MHRVYDARAKDRYPRRRSVRYPTIREPAVSALRVVHVERHLYGIKSPGYDNDLVAACRLIPGTAWNPAARAWVGYADAVAAVCRILEKQGIPVQDAEELTPEFDPAAIIPICAVAEAGLRPSQKDGVKFLLRKAGEGAILAWEMSCGKTAVTLRAIRALKVPAVIVCPNHARGVWGDGPDSEVKKWWPEAWPPRMLSGTKPPLAAPYDPNPEPRPPPPMITVIHYDILYAWAQWLIDEGAVRFVAYDEGHICAADSRPDRASRRSKAAKLLARACSHRVILSGTPLTNRPKSLWNVIDTVSEDRMGWFFTEPPPAGKRYSFATRYCGAVKEQVTKDKVAWNFNGSSNEEEFNFRLQFMMSRLTKAAISSELPPKQRQVIDLEVPIRNLIDPRSTVEDGKINQRMLRRALDVAADAKLPQVIAMILERVAAGDSVVAFCWRRAVAEAVADACATAGYDAAFIHGELPLKKREAIIARKPQVLAATYDTTSTAINLTFANVTVAVELIHEPWKFAQSEARVDRVGQKRHVTCLYPVARGSSDELIRRACITKIAAFDAIIGPAGDSLRGDLEAAKEKSGKAALKSLYEAIMRRGDIEGS